MSNDDPAQKNRKPARLPILIVAGLVLVLAGLWWAGPFLRRPAPPPAEAIAPPAKERPAIPVAKPPDPVLVQVERLETGSLEEHQQAVAALARMGPAAKAAVPALAKQMHQCLLDRSWPAQPLGGRGPTLSELAEREQHARAVGKALAAIDPEGGAAALVDGVLSTAAHWDDDLEPGPRDLLAVRGDRIYLDVIAELGPAAVPAMIAAFGERKRYRSFVERLRPDHLVSEAEWADIAGFGPVFARIGPPCVPPLRAALKHKDAQVRCFAALALGNLGRAAAEAAPDLRGRLRDDDDDVRLAAAYALLGRTADDADRALPVLIEMLQRLAAVPGYEKRWRFLAALLGEIGPQAEPAAAALGALLPKRRQQSHRIARVLRRLGAVCRKAAPELVGLLREAKPTVKNPGYHPAEEALEALLVIGPAARETVGPALGRLLEDKDLVLRWRAFQALGAIDPSAALKAYPMMRKTVAALDFGEVRERQRRRARRESITAADPAPLNRQNIGASLEALTGDDAAAVPLLVGAWQSGRVAEPALRALKRMGQAAATAAPALVAGLEQGPYDWEVPGVLAAIGKPAVPALREALRNGKPATRKSILLVLEQIGPGATVVPAVSAALTDKDEEVRNTAAVVLGRFGPDAKEAVPALRAALKDASGPVRREAAEALGRVGPEARGALPDLIRAFTDDAQLVTDPETGKARSVAVRAASRIGKDAVDPLLAALKDGTPRMRAGAAEALGRIGPHARKALPCLLQVSANEREPAEVRAAAEEARKKLEPD
jgi:HEAT repeat protein